MACCHQPAMMFLIGKVFCFIGREFASVLLQNTARKVRVDGVLRLFLSIARNSEW